MKLPLKLPETVDITLTKEELLEIKNIAINIFNEPKKRNGRDQKTILAHTYYGLLLEYALVRQGAKRNPAEFDHTTPSSHNWDVDWQDWRCEVKKMENPETLGQYTGKKAWLTLAENMTRKIVRNRKQHPGCVDIVLLGHYTKLEGDHSFRVKFRAALPFDTVHKSFKRCNPDYAQNWIENKQTGEKALKYFYNKHANPDAIIDLAV